MTSLCYAVTRSNEAAGAVETLARLQISDVHVVQQREQHLFELFVLPYFVLPRVADTDDIDTALSTPYMEMMPVFAAAAESGDGADERRTTAPNRRGRRRKDGRRGSGRHGRHRSSSVDAIRRGCRSFTRRRLRERRRS